MTDTVLSTVKVIERSSEFFFTLQLTEFNDFSIFLAFIENIVVEELNVLIVSVHNEIGNFLHLILDELIFCFKVLIKEFLVLFVAGWELRHQYSKISGAIHQNSFFGFKNALTYIGLLITLHYHFDGQGSKRFFTDVDDVMLIYERILLF